MLVLASLLYAEIAGMTKDSPLFAVQQFAERHDFMNIGTDRINAVDKPSVSSTPMCIFMPKWHSLPFLVWCIAGGPTVWSRLPVLFFVELVDEMIVVSTMLRSRSTRPFSSRCLFTSLNSTLPRHATPERDRT